MWSTLHSTCLACHGISAGPCHQCMVTGRTSSPSVRMDSMPLSLMLPSSLRARRLSNIIAGYINRRRSCRPLVALPAHIAACHPRRRVHGLTYSEQPPTCCSSRPSAEGDAEREVGGSMHDCGSSSSSSSNNNNSCTIALCRLFRVLWSLSPSFLGETVALYRLVTKHCKRRRSVIPAIVAHFV